MADVEKVHLDTVVAIEANGEIIARKNLLRAITEFFEQMKQKRVFEETGDALHIFASHPVATGLIFGFPNILSWK